VPTAKTVAFAFFSPDGLRVIFMNKNYRVFMHTSADELPPLKEEARNLVIVPNIDRLNDLAPLTDRIHRIIVLARGKHEAIIQRGIPLVDSIVREDEIEMVPTRTAERYCQAVEEEAVDIELSVKPEVPKQSKVRKKPEVELQEETPSTLTQYIDHLAENWVVVDLDFDHDLVEPTALFLVGETTQDEFKLKLKKLIKHGFAKETARSFYSWAKSYLELILDAAREAIEDDAVMINIAKRYAVPIGDLQLIADVYNDR